MQRIEFSELTNRLHRNLVLIAAILIAIVGFNIQIKKATSFGVEFENLTTSVILVCLLVLLAYHMVALAIRAFEDYRIWELKLVDKQTTGWGGGVFVIDLADQMKEVADLLSNILNNGGAIVHGGQTIVTPDHVDNLKAASNAAVIYGKRLKNFPYLTRVRFWVWDIGVATVISMIALGFGFSILPAGILMRCVA